MGEALGKVVLMLKMLSRGCPPVVLSEDFTAPNNSRHKYFVFTQHPSLENFMNNQSRTKGPRQSPLASAPRAELPHPRGEPAAINECKNSSTSLLPVFLGFFLLFSRDE